MPNLNTVTSSAPKCLIRSCLLRVPLPLATASHPHWPLLPTHILPPSGPTEISDGMEISDELSVCSDNSYDMYANSAPTPKDNRGSGSRTKTLTDRSGR